MTGLHWKFTIMPYWLNVLAVISLIAGGISAVIVVADLLSGYKQHMPIMNLVWPITMLYSGPLGLWAYFMIGRLSSNRAIHMPGGGREKMQGMNKPFWQETALAATHCGADCTLGALCAEGLVLALPFTLFGEHIFAAWLLDFVFAYIFGIAFQYFTIAPMKHVSFGEGIALAIKVDTLSLLSWQIGMYGWMAIAVFAIFGHDIPKTNPVFWFMVQIAMVGGFVTAYPVNAFLLRAKIKEPM